MNHKAINVEPAKINQVIVEVKNLWNEAATEQLFKNTMPDAQMNQLYTGEQNTGKIQASFSRLALLIATMGLFGLSTQTIESRMREFGIRKIWEVRGSLFVC